MNANSNANSAAQPTAPAKKSTGPSFSFVDALKYIGKSLIRPFQTFSENLDKIDVPKNAFMLAGIVTLGSTLLYIIGLILQRVVSTDGRSMQWLWSNLRTVDFHLVIFKSLALFAGIILITAGIFYIANLVAKRQVSFGRFLSLTTTAVVPYVIGTTLASIVAHFTWISSRIAETTGGTVASMFGDLDRILDSIEPVTGSTSTSTPIGYHIATILGVLGLVYAIVIAVSLISHEMQFDNKSHGLYYAAIALGITLSAGAIAIPRAERSIHENLTSRSVTVTVDGSRIDCGRHRNEDIRDHISDNDLTVREQAEFREDVNEACDERMGRNRR